jgi:signal transduction histidine kinase
MAVEVRTAVDRAEQLIEALLTLARSDRGGLAREPADLAVLAEDALDAAGPEIRARSLQVSTALDAALLHGDPVLLGRLAANLIDNAVRHNQPGGWIQVATSTGPPGTGPAGTGSDGTGPDGTGPDGTGPAGSGTGTVWLAVANGGPQIPAELAGTLFEPFRRLAGRVGPGGSGLGLSIVASVAAAHQGTATARALPAGGLEVTVTLPGG